MFTSNKGEDVIPGEYKLDFERTLLQGGYNLLLGAGISMDSDNAVGTKVQSADNLRRQLCTLKGVPDTMSLTRVAGLLTDAEVSRYLVQPFSNCVAAATLLPVVAYLWRRVFTFNIDDVLENAYEISTAKQSARPINYDTQLEPTPVKGEIQIIHLHGWVGKPDARFVFSRNEYAQVTRSLNPWMHVLSEILSTESFIIAGTSLDESDLEFYLSHRSAVSPRRSRGPSLLIEPFPNAATHADCGLVLVEATFAQLLAWLRKEYPLPPSVADLIVPQTAKLFSAVITQSQTLRFYSDFAPVEAADEPLPTQPSRFLDGREPDWQDINSHVDIERKDNATLLKAVETAFSDHSKPPLIILSDGAGTGKTTIIKRVAHSCVLAGRIVLTVATNSRIDVKNTIACLSEATAPVLLLIDGVADHASQLADILGSKEVKIRLVMLASDRKYRMDFVNINLGHLKRTDRGCQDFTSSELQQVIERYRSYGLLAESEAIRDPKAFSRRLEKEPIAIVTCRLLDDYRPLQVIVASLWDAANERDRMAYLAAALAQYCYSQGIRYSTLQSVTGADYSIAKMFVEASPLRLAENDIDDDFVVPINAVIGDQILRHCDRRSPKVLQEVFKRLAIALAPYVNRSTVMKKTPESRLAGRLFDADKVVRPLLGLAAEQFYTGVAKDWEWNSRYWEQRALLVLDTRPHDALSYSRHAVAIERHPHTLTTLSKVLISLMTSSSSEMPVYFNEAFAKLSEAITSEERRSRVTIHPYMTLYAGTFRYLQAGRFLTSEQRIKLTTHLAYSVQEFPHDVALRSQEQMVKELM